MRHLLSVQDLTRSDIDRVIHRADAFAEVVRRDVKKVPALRGRTVVNLFLEASTRTSASFELAAKRLSADTVSIRSSGSSIEKGESLRDTIATLSAYNPAAVVVRSPYVGSGQLVAQHTDAAVINAGDGGHEHPTQALLDVHTIHTKVGELDGLKVWIVGDVAHSRVARSNISLFGTMGAEVTLCGPPTLMPREVEALGCRVTTTLDQLGEADIVYVLRLQNERMREAFLPSIREYVRSYQIDAKRLRSGQWIMHPGPVNRGVELADELIDHPQSLIQAEVESGLVVRMAILFELLAAGSPQDVENGYRAIEGGRV